MKPAIFLEAMGEIDGRFVEEAISSEDFALAPEPVPESAKAAFPPVSAGSVVWYSILMQTIRKPAIRVLAAVAVLALLLPLAWNLFQNSGQDPNLPVVIPPSDTTSSASHGGSQLTEPSIPTESSDPIEPTTESTWFVARPEELPLLRGMFANDGYAFEAYQAQNPEDLKTSNPWRSAAAITSLPVYKNLAFYSMAGETVLYSDEELGRRTAALAQSVGAEILELTFTKIPARKPAEPVLSYGVKAATTLGLIDLRGDGTGWFTFDEPLTLPEELFLVDEKDVAQSTFLVQETRAAYVYRYLTEHFPELYAELVEPVFSFGDWYEWNGESQRTYYAFESSEDPDLALLYYSFGQYEFTLTEDNRLIRIKTGPNPRAVEMIGDYPIISEAEARQKLKAMAFYTSLGAREMPDGRLVYEYLPDQVITDEQIGHVELMYRTSAIDAEFLPYYKYWMKIDLDGKGLEKSTTYATFYVPAVRGEYLENLPPQLVRFN